MEQQRMRIKSCEEKFYNFFFFSNKIASVATGHLQCGNLIEINCKHKIYTEFQGQFEKRNIKYLISYF